MALQRRLEEVTAMHQQAADESEALRVRPVVVLCVPERGCGRPGEPAQILCVMA